MQDTRFTSAFSPATRSRTRLRHTGVALVIALGLIASGCGSSGDADASGDEESSGNSEASQKPDPLTEDDFVERLTEAYQDKGTAHVTYESERGEDRYEAEGDIKFAESNDDMQVTGTAKLPSGTTDMRADVRVLSDERAFVNAGDETDDKYLPVDLSDDDDPIAQTVLTIAGTVHDIAGTLDRLDEMMTSFEKTGEPEDIDGVQAQPYTIVLDASKSDAGDDANGGEHDDGVYTYRLYVDGDDLIRRVETENDVDDTTIEWEYSDWGKPVEIEEPGSSEIIGGGLGK